MENSRKLDFPHSLWSRARALSRKRKRERRRERERVKMYSEPSSENPLNACTFCGRQQLNSREYNHIRDTLHQLSPAELENRGFCFVCLNEQNILWQLITDHDDIFQTHIVCKLNGADLKFLNQANSESREAMKRSKNVASVPGKFNGKNALLFEIEANSRKRFG